MNAHSNRKSFAVALLFTALALLGLCMYCQLPVGQTSIQPLPEITVTCSCTTTSPRLTEERVTRPLEAALSRIGKISGIESISGTGFSEITIRFDRSKDMTVARFETAAAIRHIWPLLHPYTHFPSITVTKNIQGGNTPSMVLYFISDTTSDSTADYVKRNILPALSQVKGVRFAEIANPPEKKKTVICNSSLLQALNLSPANVHDAISNVYSSAFFSGNTDGNESRIRNIFIQFGNSLSEIDLQNIPVSVAPGRTITLGQIARIYDNPTQDTQFRINGKNAIAVNIYTESSANIFSIIAVLQNFVDSISGHPHARLAYVENNMLLIANDITKTAFRLLVLIILLTAVFAIVSRNLKRTLLVLHSLSISLMIAGMVFALLGIGINPDTLTGIIVSLILSFQIFCFTVLRSSPHRKTNVISYAGAALTSIALLSYFCFYALPDVKNLFIPLVIIIAILVIDIFITVFFIPACYKLFNFDSPSSAASTGNAGLLPKFLTRHSSFRVILIPGIVLAFGLPLFLLPDALEPTSFPASAYNKVMNTDFIRETVRPALEKYTGGALRLLYLQTKRIKTHQKNPVSSIVTADIKLPSGSQQNNLMEYVSSLENTVISIGDGVLAKTIVKSPTHAIIAFIHNQDNRVNPFETFYAVVDKAHSLGGPQWNISGPNGLNFNNSVNENYVPDIITLKGYDYDRLLAFALQLRDSLKDNKRINDVLINSGGDFQTKSSPQFMIHPDNDKLSPEALRSGGLNQAINYWNSLSSPISVDNTTSKDSYSIDVTSDKKHDDAWELFNSHLKAGDNLIKLNGVSSTEPTQLPDDIMRIDRQFIVNLQFDFIGDRSTANKTIKRILTRFSPLLPKGFSSELRQIDRNSWNSDYPAILLHGLIVSSLLILFPSIFFNSVKSGLLLLLTTMLALSGGFLTIHCLDMEVDNGAILALLVTGMITIFYTFFLLSSYFDGLKSLRRGKKRSLITSYPITSVALSFTLKTVIPVIILTTIAIIMTMAANISENFILWDNFSKTLIGGLTGSVIAMIIIPPLILVNPHYDHKGCD